MKLKSFLTGVSLVVFLMGLQTVNAQSLSPSTKWHWDKGTIVVETPERPAGQEHALGLTTAPIQTVRVGFVGVGRRGIWAVWRFSNIPGVKIVGLCDYHAENAEKSQKHLRDAGLAPATIYSGEKGYEELCKRPDVDLIYIATDWNHHFPVAKFAMENGKHVALEVPAAMNLELGALSMDNNCAAVTFPDFTRGHWNEMKGYRHAYATPEQEAATEAAADAYTAAQKEVAAKLNLWALYDATRNAEGKAKVAAEKKYMKAAAKLDAQIEKTLKTKK